MTINLLLFPSFYSTPNIMLTSSISKRKFQETYHLNRPGDNFDIGRWEVRRLLDCDQPSKNRGLEHWNQVSPLGRWWYYPGHAHYWNLLKSSIWVFNKSMLSISCSFQSAHITLTRLHSYCIFSIPSKCMTTLTNWPDSWHRIFSHRVMTVDLQVSPENLLTGSIGMEKRV